MMARRSDPVTLSVLALLLVTAGLRGPLTATPEPRAGASLESRVRSLLGGAGLVEDDVSICVLDPRGRQVVSISGDRAVKPASNMKIVTTLAALEVLGPDHEYVTQLRSTAGIVGGAIAGDLILRGTGDPNISARHQKSPTELLELWAERLRGVGLERIDGDIVLDDRHFDSVRYHPSWDARSFGRPYSAQVSALNFNDNCVEIRVLPAAGGRASVEVIPASSAIEIIGSPRVSGARAKITIHRFPNSNRMQVGGTIPARSDPWYDHVAIDDPAVVFGETLRAIFERGGISIAGRVRRPREADASEKAREEKGVPAGSDDVPAPLGALVLVEHRSKLSVDLPTINKESQNLHAETLLKTLGAERRHEGSWEAGAAEVVAIARRLGLPVEGLVVSDGSGLSHDNRVPAALIAQWLHLARSRPWFETFRDSLAIAGADGTLDDRFSASDVRHLLGAVRGKTGSIRDVSALSGYIERDDGTWCVSLLFARLPRGRDAVRRLEERICALVAPRGSVSGEG